MISVLLEEEEGCWKKTMHGGEMKRRDDGLEKKDSGGGEGGRVWLRDDRRWRMWKNEELEEGEKGEGAEGGGGGGLGGETACGVL